MPLHSNLLLWAHRSVRHNLRKNCVYAPLPALRIAFDVPYHTPPRAEKSRRSATNGFFHINIKETYFYQFFTISFPPRFDTTSKITAARRTAPLTTFCMLASTPISDIPRLITPISTAPTITPGTVPIPP